MGKLIENVIKNRVVVVTAAMFAVVMSFIMSNRMIKNDNNVATITDPETLRAMSYEEITAEDEVVGGIDTLKFSAFFLRDIDGDGIANKLKGTCNDVSEKPDTLYINFNLLGDGKLKNAKITLYQSNFNWNSEIVQDNIVASSYSGNVTTITLKNELIGGSQKLFSGSIYPYIRDNINNYTGVNRVVLTGTYVDDEGIETPIEKSIDLTVDWYGTTKTIVNKNNLLQTKEMKTLIENDTVKVKFEAVVTETEEELILQKQVAELKIPDLNGYAATNAYTTTSRANSQFDSENKTLTITNNANVKQNGDVQVAIARGNTYEVVVEYPLEAYEAANGGNISLDFPIKGYNYGYNNPNTEFSNPYVSSDSNTITVVYTADADPGEGGQTIIPTGNTSEYSVGISVGDFVYSKTIGSEYRISQDTILERYSGSLYEDVEDTYTVRWYAYIFDSNKISKITLEEETVSENRRTDDFTKLNLEKTSMRDYETTVGISFENASKILGSNGYIKLYNAETDTLIETFTRANWNSTYRVGLDDLKSIKIETSSPIANGALGVHQTKKIDDSKVIEDFTKEEFQSFRYIYSYVKGTAYSAGANLANGDTTWTRYSQERAKYEGSLSIQNISVQPQEISNQDTRNVNIIINTSATNDFESGWIDGVFLVELPEDFLEVAVNSVTVNNNNVKISNWSYFEENGKKYIKIYTSNSNEETYNITINAAITANPLAATKPETIGLYAYNKNCNNYYYNALDQYDLDEDLSAQDLIGYSTTTLTTVAPSGLLTTEYITNYDEYSSVTIAPNIAEIEKTDGSRTATVNIRLIDNYTGTISDVCILGRIPYEGNRYILVDRDLKSEYTAHITGPISIPTNQVNNVTIYYSANGNANNDKDGTNNGWMLAEDVTDWTTIKSYLIDFGDYVFTEASEDTFSYEVEIPAGVGYDSATYSNHAVYYSLETPNGKLEMETEPNRVGMQVVGKYTLNLTKNKVGKTGTFVPGATYRVVAKDANDNLISKIAVTDENGNLTFNDMYIGREYTLEEIASPSDYSLTEGIIVFNTSVNDQGQLIVDVIHDIEHGITRDFNETPTVTLDNNGNYVVNAKVEDEAKYTITINKSDEEGNPLASTIFKFGTDERTKNYITDSNGQIVITGLELDKEYIIQETRSDGYYVDEEEKSFKITRDENGLKIVTEDPILANAVIDSPNNKAQTQVTIDIENEKIPTYKLRITKVNKTKDGEAETTLEGAYFRIASADTQKQEEYKTDENGIIEIDGLYLHVDGKYVSGRYEIQETKAPGGYLNSSDLIAIEVNGVYNDQTQKYDLDISVENEDQLESVKSITVESDTVKIVVQDKPLFQLTKVDSDTGEILANVEFIVYKMEKDGTTDYAKDEYGNYIGIPNDQGEYIVTTDENGVISLPLPDGKYCLVEVTYPEGYQVKEEAEYFIIGDDDGEEVEDEDKKVIEINYIEDLVELSEKTNNGYSYKNAIIKLMRDLDFNDPGSYRSGEIDWNLVETENSQGFTPIGKQNCNFTGIFDGQGHTISNLYVNCDEAYIGLFGRISDSEIKNLNVNGIVGCESLTSSTLSDVYAGGITGYSSNSKISNCCCNIEFDIPTNSASYVGGIVGLVENGEVCDCYNDTGFEISKTSKSYYAYTFTGGIIGKASNSIIKRCYNNGNISGSNNGGGATSSQKPRVYTHTGGIAGDISNTDVLNCYNTGDIYSYAYTNGYIEGTAYHDYWVKVGEAYSGGIVGYVDNGNIEDSYNVGNITRSGISSSGNYGIAGYLSNGERINCYNLSGKGTSDETGVTQYTDEYMKSSNFVQDLGSESWSKVANQNSDYPILEDNTEDITVINYIDDLVDLAIDVNNGNSYEGKTIKLMRDLDFNDASSYKNNQVDTSLTSSGTGFNIIGISKKTPFSGIFDGQGHTISNLYIKTDKDYVGLFGYISEAEIKNLSITGSVEEYLVISTNAYDDLQETKYVGGFVGFSSYSGIDNCSNACVVTGRVSLTNTKGSSASTGSAASSQVNIGSIVGNATYSRISNCYNTNNVNGRSTSNCKNTSSQNYCSSYSTVLIGGIVGHINESNVVNCYNRGNVESSASAGSSNYVYKDANARAGGICGTESSSVISNVYNTGNVSASASENSSGGIVATNGSATTVTNAYYLDTITIQGTVIQRGETRTESQMKNADFVDELGDRYWSLNESENDGYPVLNNEVELITEINYIEDLVQLSNDVNNGKSYKDHVVTLMRDLDFNDPSSYRSGVVNQDLISGENNGGFIPIGCDSGSAFSGTFEGQGYEIRNIYVNSGKTYAGLFGRLDGAKVRDLGLTGEIAGNSKYAGGIAGEILNGAVIMNCYNTAKISGKIYVGGIAGDSKDSIIKYTNNSGTIEGVNNVGGIVGRLSNSKAEYSYNTGNINGNDAVGGIAGYVENESLIIDTYNTGKAKAKKYAGGIAGYTSAGDILNSYNVGSVKATDNSGSYGYAGAIIGYKTNISSSNMAAHNSYYVDSVVIDGRIINNKGTGITDDYMKSKEFYSELNVDGVWMYRKDKYPILINKQIKNVLGDSTELTINNTIKKFIITTDIKEIDGVKGGTITGEDEKPYETVDYAESSTKAISIVPDEGYVINSITINDEDFVFVPESDGTYTFAAGYFSNMDEDKNIVVSFSPKDKTIYISKVDKEGNPLGGAEFSIESNNDTPELGTLTNNNANYYFVENEGVYVSNNNGVNSSCANSYIKLDLTNYHGKYNVVVNAQVSSQSGGDYGYVTITKTTTAPAYNSTTGRLIYISGTVSARDYSTELEAGDIYYIHLGYNKNASTNTGNDCFTVNSVNVVPVVETYTAVTNEGGIAILPVTYLGKYKIKETKAPEHYIIDDTEKEIELVSGASVQTVEFENKRKTEIVVHHYLEGTTNKVAEDDVLWGEPGESFEARPHTDLEKLSVVENQEYYAGTFGDEGAEYIIYYKAAKVKLTIHHYYEGTEKSLVEDKVIYQDSQVIFTGEAEYQVVTDASYVLNTNEDYTVLKEDNEFVGVTVKNRDALTIEDTLEYNTDTEITYYYKLKEVNYKVQYFYNNVLDEDKTEYCTEVCDVTIESYIDKCTEGYKFDYVKALDENGDETEMPLTLRANEEYNVINVYYITDDTQQKDIGYIVEYYKDGVRVEEDTQIKTGKVQVLENTMEVDKDDINIVDKYLGYKFDSSNPAPIPDTIENGGIIKVYYVFDEDATKELKYTVEYYLDSVKVEADTQEEKIIVHVLQPDTLTVDKTKINTVDKYEGSICTSTNPSTIPDIVNTGSVIKVYYMNVVDYKFGKIWNGKTEEEVNKHRTTYTLYKNINGSESTVTNSNRKIVAVVNDATSTDKEVTYSSTSTTVTITVIGNGTVEFKNLPRYSNGNEITYLVKETRIERTTNNGTSWSTQSLNNYRINYNDEYEGLDRRVENTETFKITTEIAPNGANERVGGTITGEFTSAYPESSGKRYVETVNESETPVNDIVIDPDEGYIITGITINGSSYSYTPDANGNVTIAKEYFQNIKENKHIVVSFIDTTKLIKIIKEDEYGNRLAGAEFSISNKNDYSSHIGAITADPDYDYYFEEMSDGSFASNNVGVDGSTAGSYSDIDLSDLTGTFNLRVNASISSESGYDYGYIEVEDIETGSVETLVSNSGSERNIIREVTLQGGKEYKIYYRYSKDESSGSGDDRFYINSVKIETGDEYTATTNENGEALVEVYSDSAYNVKETKAPAGYIKSDEIKSVTAPNEVSFVNSADTYVITTEVGINSLGERSGGTITGEYTEGYLAENNIKFVESVRGTQNATMDIEITPTSGYEVSRITINGENYTFEADSNGNVVIPRSEFTNVTSDKHIVVKFEEEEKTVTIIKTNKRSGQPLQGAKFRLTSNFERGTNVDSYISDMYGDPVYNQYSFDYSQSTGTYTSNNQHEDGTMAIGYKIVDLTTLTGEYTFVVNAEVSSEESYDSARVIIDDISPETAQADINYDNLQNSYEMFYASGESSSQDYTTTLYGGKKYAIYFIYSKDGSEYSGEDTFTINSIGFENSSAPIVVETDLTDAEGKATFNIRGYGEYTVSEIVTPDGFITMDDMTFELLPSEDNQIINIENERESVIYSTYTVNYYEKNTTTPLETSKTSGEVEVDSQIMATDEVINIDGYEFDSADVDSIFISEDSEENVINLYYTKRNDLSYTVNYLEKGTDHVLHTSKTEPNQTFGDEITSVNEKITIDGYNYDSVDPEVLTIGASSENNVINVYYTKRNNLSYTVHYREQGVDGDAGKLADDKVEGNQVFGDKVTENAIDIPGFEKVEPTSAEIEITTGTNEHTFYYTRITGLSYTVNYLEKGTDHVLHTSKTEPNQTFGDEITSVNEKITIDGYNYDSVDPETLVIGAVSENNVINVYYTKRNNLSYTVHYREQGVDGDAGKLADDKVEGNQVFGDKVTENAIDIPGYDKVNPTSAEIEITTGTNEHTFYYTKRNDLSYTVNYLEKGTDNVLHTPKTEPNQTFGDEITSVNEKITIDGYNYDSVDPETLVIGAVSENNIINIYYTKRNDLSYTVNYLEKGTDEVLHEPKTEPNQTFGDEITSVNEKITIDGYNYDSVDPETLVIGAVSENNVINVYYTKRNDLSYTVNYLEKGTDNVLHTPKTEPNQTFGDEITSVNEKITIDGYNYDSVDPETLVIGAVSENNVINVYYTKRNDLSYTVNYLEKGTDNVLHTPKTEPNQTFGDEITSADEKITIDGYNYDSVDPETLVIGAVSENNIINIYYTKRNDLSYTVNYLEKGTDHVLHTPKTEPNQTFGDEITSVNEKITIDGYNYDSVDPEVLTIGASSENNVINVYYTKRNNLSYTVHYREQGVDGDAGKLADDKVEGNQVFGDKVTENAIDIPGFEKVEPTSAEIEITTGTNEHTFYYTRITGLSYTVNYLEKDTNEEIETSKTVPNKTFGDKITAANEVIPIDGYKYDSVDPEELTIGVNSVDNVINIYYTKRDDMTYTVHYYYDGVEDEDAKETLTATYKSIITTYDDKSEGYVLERVTPVDSNGDLYLEITSNPADNIINVFYRTQYKVTTKAKTHTEMYKDGSTRSVKGGTISGDGETAYEYVFKGDDTTKSIIIRPSEGYEIVSVKINDVALDFSGLLLRSGYLNLNAENGFFTNMSSDEHVEVEFRKISSVIVKYLEKDTNEVLAAQDDLYGNEGEAFETARKSVSYYQAVNITDENGNAISTYSRVTSDDELSATGTMYADTLTIIYWYEKIPSGIIVKHIAINEVDKQNLDMEDGILLDEETIPSYAGQSETTNRNSYTNYIAVNGPASSDNVIVAGAAEDSKTVICGENVVKEVRYYYERQYKVITESGENGTISGEDDDVYEYISDRGYNSNEIVITPDSGYRVKEITINGTVYPLIDLNEDETTHVITLGAGSTNAFFTDVQEDKNVSVEFEKIPAKVVVKYLDTATGEEVIGTPEKVVEGYVGDSYNEPAIDIPGYILAEDTTEHPLPTNTSGPMTEADIEIVYWYTKQFTITTSAGEGGTCEIEGGVDSEVVTRGDSNTLKITITPDSAHTLDKILVNDVELDYENDPNIVIGDGYVEIPANYFTNVQENIYVVAEFARIPATVKVEYLDENDNSLYVDENGNEYETINGYVNDRYETTPKDIPYYTVVEDRLPRNAKGTMGTDEITVTYYYRKSLFNMKVEKEIVDVVVNNEVMDSTNNKKNIDVSIKYKDINSVNIKAIYKIKVTNTEEVAGTAVLEEEIPEGFEFIVAESDPSWNLVDGKYVLTTDEILPGSTKEYIVVLRWLVSETNKGTKINKAEITGTENGASYNETTLDDNKDRAIINITLEQTNEDIDEPEVDIKDKELEPELIAPDKEIKDEKKSKSIKTGDEVIYYIVGMAIAGVIMIISIKKRID